jgi:antitoxin Phd
MTTYTYSMARQHFSDLLNQAKEKGEVYIQRQDGSLFVVKPFSRKASPLDVPGIKAGISRNEIVDVLREVRKR